MSGRASFAACARGLLQGAAGARARDLSRCRRRVRIALQYLSGAGRGGVGGAPRRAAGEMDRRPQRSVPHRLYRARRRDARAPGLRPQGPRARAGAHGQYRSAHRLLRPAQQRLPRCANRLRRADGMGALARRDDQHGADGAVPWRRTAEATTVMERLMDIAAKRLKIDRVDLRRRNLIRRDALPHRTATGLTYDSGDFAGNLARALQTADWDGFPARRREAKKRGRLLGIGVANYVETPVGMPHERVAIKVSAAGSVALIVGTQSSGQGHETSFRQVLADQLGVDPGAINFVSGDSATLASGGGTHSDRSMRLAGSLMVETSRKVIDKARAVAAVMLDVAEGDISFVDGLFVAPNSNRRLTLFDIARAIDELASLPDDLRVPLAAEASFTGRIPAYPTGAAVCEAEVDPETGAIEIRRYTSIDDGGQPINPLILHGQVHGGVAQGVGQAMMEAAIYEPGSGQLLSASFLDYGMPRADHFPHLDVELTEDPTKGNALRVKGGGEAGITPSSAVLMNAVLDALSGMGIEHMDMPATPQRVWSAICVARDGSRGS